MDLNELNLTDEQKNLVAKLIQSETDKVRTDYSTRLKTVNDELAKYKPIEKSETEKKIEERLKALELKEQELNLKERQSAVKEALNKNGLPVELAKYVNVGDDIDGSVKEFAENLGSVYLQKSFKPTNHTTI